MMRATGAALIAACLALTAVPALAATPLAMERDGVPSLAPLVRGVTDGVVNIATKTTQRMQPNPLLDDPFFRRFFNIPPGMQQPRERTVQSAGSGVIVDAAKGYVMTNHHVVDKADEIVVTLKDQRRLTAKLVGSDPDSDLAILQVPADRLRAVPLGNSDALEVGDFVVAIGNPFGLGQTVTSGIVSALGRRGLGIESYEDFIQTDASINPGNSGGALVNLKGELIGINTAILGPSGGNIGIGFAIPINMARAVMQQIVEFGEVRRGQLGVSIQNLTPELSEALNTRTLSGAVVSRVQPGSAAEDAGLEQGDVIVGLNGAPIQDSADLRNRVGLLPPGSKAELKVIRKGREMTINATIGKPQDSAQAGGVKDVPQLAGVQLEVQPARRGENGGRVIVTRVDPDTKAYEAGLRPGDVILSVNQQRVSTLEDVSRAGAGRPGKLLVQIGRDQGVFFTVIG
jgi:serine protease DegQ